MNIKRTRALAGVGILVSLLLPAAPPAAGEPAPPKQLGLEEFIHRVAMAASTDATAHAAIEAAKDSVAVVFVPGILGSRLARRGKVIWGRDAPEAADLALDASGDDPGVEPTLLTDYSLHGLTRADIYGEFDRALEQARNGRGLRLDFAYDWRRDIAANADRLDAFLRGTPALQGKSVVLVAHSMGGVVAWTWQSRKYRQTPDEPLTVRRLVLLGSPLNGSCEMARMLLLGYQPTPGAGKVEGVLYRALFGDVRAAAFTFPSIFELLPPVPVDPADLDASCVEVPLGPEAADRIPGNYFSADFWRTDFGRQLLGTPWEDLGIPAGEFFRRLEPVLKAAGDFRGSLNLNDLRLPVTFFYAADYRTVLKALVRRAEGGGFRVEFPFDGPGDGRVASASAKNEGFAQGTQDFRRLSLGHGDLPKDPRFVTYVGQELGRIISAQVALEAARAILRDDILLEKYMEEGGGLISSTAVAASLGDETDPTIQPTINALNAQLLTWLGVRPTYAEVRARQNEVKVSDPQLHRDLTPLLEVVLAEPGKLDGFNRTFALGRLGWALLDGGNSAASLVPLAQALARVEAAPALYRRHEAFRKTLLFNLGMAYFRTGSCDQARRYLELSADLGSESAREYLAKPCIDRETGQPK